MNYLKLTLFILLFSAFAVYAQDSKPITDLDQPQTKEINIQLTPFGYITLPKGYWAFMDYDMMDAWSGMIETLDGSFKIRFSDGIIVSVFEGEDKNIKWKKELKTENYSINYALADNGKIKRILAKIKTANFSAQIQDDSDIDKVLEIISRYCTGQCEKCFNSHNTKSMKKYFERLTHLTQRGELDLIP